MSRSSLAYACFAVMPWLNISLAILFSGFFIKLIHRAIMLAFHLTSLGSHHMSPVFAKTGLNV